MVLRAEWRENGKRHLRVGKDLFTECLAAELGGGGAELAEEEVAQGAFVGVAALLRDVGDGTVGGGEEFAGPCEAPDADLVVDGASGGREEALLRRAEPKPHGVGDVGHADAFGKTEADALDAAHDARIVRPQHMRALAPDDEFRPVDFAEAWSLLVCDPPREEPDGEFAGTLEVGRHAGKRGLGVLAAKLVVVDADDGQFGRNVDAAVPCGKQGEIAHLVVGAE